ncbi:MAG: hypothetical protein Q7T78_14590 [Rhodoferax sp.]|nr:hypothetical protein [Rhodoferax sp.]
MKSGIAGRTGTGWRAQAFLNAVGRFPDGASIEQVEVVLESSPSRRTLQRWLMDLIAQQRLRKEAQ